MAVTTFDLKLTNGGAQLDSELNTDDRIYRPTFIAVVDRITDGPLTILADPRCPRYGGYYAFGSEVDQASLAKKFTFKPMGGRWIDGSSGAWAWEVEVEFNSKVDQGDQPPGAEPAKIHYETQTADVYGRVDINGKMLVNSAGMPFDPPEPFNENWLIIRVEKSTPSFNPFLAQACNEAVNSQPFLGFDANTLKISKISAQQTDGGTFGQYYRLAIEMQYRPKRPNSQNPNMAVLEPHQGNVPDMGRYEWIDKPGGGKQLDAIKDKDGNPVTEPVMMDGQGRKLQNPDAPSAGFLIRFQKHPKVDFNILGIYP